MAIDPNIKNKAQKIRTEIYGKDVRESLASGLEAMSEDVVNNKNRQDAVEQQFQDVLDETTDKDFNSAPEIKAARGGHDNLSQRLLSQDQQLQQNILSDEQLRVYVDLIQQQVSSMGDISPEPFDTYDELVDADPSHTGIYVVTSTGNWYYWNKSSLRWTVGGKFQETGIGETAVGVKNTSFLNETADFSHDIFQNFIKTSPLAMNSENNKLEAYKDVDNPTIQHRLAVIPLEPYRKYRINAFLHNRYRVGVLNSLNYTIPDYPNTLVMDRILLNENIPTTTTIDFKNDSAGKWLFVYVYSGAVPTIEPVVEVFNYRIKTDKELNVAVNAVEGLTGTGRNSFDDNWRSGWGFDNNGVVHTDNPGFRTAIHRIKKGKRYYVKSTGSHGSFNIATTTNLYRNPPNLNMISSDNTIKEYVFDSNLDGWLLIFFGNIGDKLPYLQISNDIISGLPDLKYNGIRLLNEYDKEEIIKNAESNFQPAHYMPVLNSANLNLSYSNFMAQFTSLQNENPDYITSRTITNDTSNTYPIYEYALTPKVVKQTIFLTAGIHGDEPESYWALYNLMKKLCDEEYVHPIMRYLRNYVKIVMIPVVNPWGYMNKTRENSRGINCNRNFDVFWIQDEANHSEGTAPFSENETKAVKDVLEKYEGQFTFHLDLHTVPTKWGEAGLHAAYAFVSPGSELSETLTATQEYMIRFWNSKFDIGVETSYKDTSTSDMKNYVQDVKKISSATLEYVSCNFSSQLADEAESTRSFEWYVNVIGDLTELFK